MFEVRWRVILAATVIIVSIFYRFAFELDEIRAKVKYAFVQKLRGAKSRKSASNIEDKFKNEAENVVVITLKNNRQVKGIIRGENIRMVTLDVGFGTAKIARKDIKRIAPPGVH